MNGNGYHGAAAASSPGPPPPDQPGHPPHHQGRGRGGRSPPGPQGAPGTSYEAPPFTPQSLLNQRAAPPPSTMGGTYKTKMCYHFLGGGCAYGAECNFAHGLHELRRTPNKKGRGGRKGHQSAPGKLRGRGGGQGGHQGGGYQGPPVPYTDGKQFQQKPSRLRTQAPNRHPMRGAEAVDTPKWVGALLAPTPNGIVPPNGKINGFGNHEVGKLRVAIPKRGTDLPQDQELLVTPSAEEIDAQLFRLGVSDLDGRRQSTEAGTQMTPVGKGKQPREPEGPKEGAAVGVTMHIPPELVGQIRMSTKPGEKKKYSRQALLLFQHMYTMPPPDVELVKVTEMLGELVYDWTPANDKWVQERRSRRRSLGGAMGWRLHAENRVSYDGQDAKAKAAAAQPSSGSSFANSEVELAEPKVKVKRRFSVPPALLASQLDDVWQEAMQEVAQPSTPGTGASGDKAFFAKARDNAEVTPKRLFENIKARKYTT